MYNWVYVRGNGSMYLLDPNSWSFIRLEKATECIWSETENV